MKNILILTQYFWPEVFQINSVAENLTKKKVNVYVFTALPNYPDGEIKKKYQNIKNIYYEKYKNINIYRCPIYPRKNSSFINLTINYFSFVYYGIKYFRNIKILNKIDHIITYSTSPITANLPAIYLKYKYKIKLSIWVQDLWPECIKSTSYIKNSFILGLINYLVKFIYKSCDQILVPSKSFVTNINHKVKNKKIIYLPNSAFNIKNNNITLPDYILSKLKKKKCFVYSGNIGKAQGIDNLVNAINYLNKNVSKNLFFFIIGDGSEKKKIVKQVKFSKIKNLIFINKKSYAFVDKIHKMACGLILTLKEDELFDKYIPNKFQNYLTAKKPIIVSAKGIVARIVKKNKIGFISSPKNPKKLAINIFKTSKLNAQRKSKIAKNCRRLYLNEFSQESQINKILKIL